jgi:hypothetical protein
VEWSLSHRYATRLSWRHNHMTQSSGVWAGLPTEAPQNLCNGGSASSLTLPSQRLGLYAPSNLSPEDGGSVYSRNIVPTYSTKQTTQLCIPVPPCRDPPRCPETKCKRDLKSTFLLQGRRVSRARNQYVAGSLLRNVPPKRRFIFNGLHGVISQKVEDFIITGVMHSKL